MTEPGREQNQYILEIEPLDLGPDVKAVGLELLERETREPARGAEASGMWSATLRGLAGSDPWALDFFAHIDRVREFCRLRAIPYEDKSSGKVILVPAPDEEQLYSLAERFAGETFGVRVGSGVAGDEAVLGELARRGVDGYQDAFSRYLFCAVCDFENGFLTLLTQKLWAGEVIRRSKNALSKFPVMVSRSNE